MQSNAPVPPTPSLRQRDRVAVLTGLFGVSLLAWLYLLDMAAGMEDMGSGAAMMQIEAWTLRDAVLMFLMVQLALVVQAL